MGPGLTQGFFGYRDYDLGNTNCLVAWGCDPLSSNRMVPNTMNHFPGIVKRGTVIAVDPRLSTIAAKAHEWLPISPGTDGALASSIAHVLLTEGMWSREFVGDFKDGKNLFVAGKAVDEAAFAEKGNQRRCQMVEPGTQRQNASMGREGIPDSGCTNPARCPRHG
jgi:anaerobic selenocysteine-containing dehydrogenase